jgi:hypothetical protein
MAKINKSETFISTNENNTETEKSFDILYR